MRSHAIFVLKLLVSAGLVWLVAVKVDLGEVGARLAGFPDWAIAAVLLLTAAQFALFAARWRVILRATGAELPDGELVRITAIGLFFNQALPSAIGGDAMRIYYARQAGTALGDAVRSVLVDRLSALLALLFILALGLPFLGGTVDDPAAELALLLVTLAGLCGFALALFAGPALSPVFGRWAPLRALFSVVEASRSVFLRRGPAARAIGLSVGIHLLAVGKVWLSVQALGPAFGLGTALLLVPPVILMTVVPVSIAGWGVREGAMIVALGYAGIYQTDAVVASLVMGLSLVALGLPGGLVWLAHRRRPPAGQG